MRLAYIRASQARMVALLKGIELEGDELVPAGEPAHAAVCQWWGDAVNLYRAGYKRVLVCELGHLGDRHRLSSAAWDGLAGRGRHALAPERPPPLLEPWRGARATGYVLILAQVPDDWAVKVALGGMPYGQWLSETRRMLERLTGLEVLVREHPEIACRTAPARGRWTSLREELEGARVAVTLNSTAAVEAVCMGVPTIAMDRGCMAYPVSSSISGGWDLEPANRRAWVNRLARLQWSQSELEDGSAWRALRVL